MFVISSTYLKTREEIAHLLPMHALWLKEQHEAGIFLSSGCNLARTGGAILAQGISKEALETLLAQSPFARAKAARYDINEVTHFADA